MGTNDLVQYTLAVDREFAPFQALQPLPPGGAPAHRRGRAGGAGGGAGIEVGVCGEMASHPLGAYALIGMGVHSLSVGPSALAESRR